MHMARLGMREHCPARHYTAHPPQHGGVGWDLVRARMDGGLVPLGVQKALVRCQFWQVGIAAMNEVDQHGRATLLSKLCQRSWNSVWP